MPIHNVEAVAGPQVGIFWFIQEPGKVPVLIGAGVAVGKGEPYGDYINYPGEHSRYWLEIKLSLPLAFHQCAPKDWPRGRVTYNRKTQRFEVYLNEQLQTPALEAEILTFFGLAACETVFASNAHYTNTCFTLDLARSDYNDRGAGGKNHE